MTIPEGTSQRRGRPEAAVASARDPARMYYIFPMQNVRHVVYRYDACF